jgi:hypothetical protein
MAVYVIPAEENIRIFSIGNLHSQVYEGVVFKCQ